jgi:class I fructose-bisphosphate aldolase
MTMTNRVDEILSWYESDNPGVLANLRRLMMTGMLAGTGKFVILPVDQGFEHGPARSFAKNAPGYDPLYHFGSRSRRAATPTRRRSVSSRPGRAASRARSR